jgi:hypothetical protein
VRRTISDPREKRVFDEAISRIDPEVHAGLEARYGPMVTGVGLDGPYKYLDVCEWIADKAARAVKFGLV